MKALRLTVLIAVTWILSSTVAHSSAEITSGMDVEILALTSDSELDNDEALDEPDVPTVEWKIPRRSGSGRRVVYSESQQRVWVVNNNEQLVRTMSVSGRKNVPAHGSYRVTSQSKESYGYEGVNVTLRWMTRFAKGPAGGNIGFHEIPRKDGKAMQTEAQLGSFAGSGCIRMSTMDVKFLYQWAKIGTPVVVTR
jgi:lipoprotein-anchoring transpeptidase ErfK/SrfK